MSKILTCIISLMMSLSYNLDFQTGIPSQELEKGLLNGLTPLADTFKDIEEKYEINSVLFASIVAVESGWGNSKLATVGNNITSYRNSDGTYKYYDSKEECLYDMAENLKKNYIDENGIYFNKSTSIDDIACYYLIGKPREEMTADEIKRTDDYVTLIKEVQRQIFKRIEDKNKNLSFLLTK